jgi:hypothetical protein
MVELLCIVPIEAYFLYCAGESESDRVDDREQNFVRYPNAVKGATGCSHPIQNDNDRLDKKTRKDIV